MNNVISFPKDIEYKVLFSLPQGKVIQVNKEPQDDFEISIEGTHGSAVLLANGKQSASGRIKKIFPTCEIVEVQRT